MSKFITPASRQKHPTAPHANQEEEEYEKKKTRAARSHVAPVPHSASRAGVMGGRRTCKFFWTYRDRVRLRRCRRMTSKSAIVVPFFFSVPLFFVQRVAEGKKGRRSDFLPLFQTARHTNMHKTEVGRVLFYFHFCDDREKTEEGFFFFSN